MVSIAIAASGSLSSFCAISPSIEENIRQSGQVFFDLFLACTFLVAVGVVLEEIELRTEKSYADEETGFHPEKRRTFKKLGLWLLVFGIAGEALFETARSWTDGLLQDVNNETFLNAEVQIRNDDKSVRNAQRDIRDLKAENAESREQANTAYLQLGTLKNTLAPRAQLLEDHKAEFIKEMSRFKGQKIFLVRCELPGEEGDEANELRAELFNFLDKFDEDKKDGAGWIVDDSQVGMPEECDMATNGDPHVPAGGIMLVLSDAFDLRVSAVKPAQKLEETLNKINITTRIAADTKLDNARILSQRGSFWKTAGDDPKAIWLLVGPRITNPNSGTK